MPVRGLEVSPADFAHWVPVPKPPLGPRRAVSVPTHWACGGCRSMGPPIGMALPLEPCEFCGKKYLWELWYPNGNPNPLVTSSLVSAVHSLFDRVKR